MSLVFQYLMVNILNNILIRQFCLYYFHKHFCFSIL